MKRKMLLVSIVVLALFAFTPSAWSAGVLDMPPNPVTMAHSDWFQADSTIKLGMYDVTLSGVEPGHDVSNGMYRGWCTEANGTVAGLLGPYPLYDSTDTAILPPLYVGKPWDKVNYLLNHQQGSRYDIQVALWKILGTFASSSLDTKFTASIVDAMVADANANGTGFVPGAGQIVAVLIYDDGFVGAESPPNQDTLIEVRVPTRGCTLTPGYWKTHSSYGPAPYDDTWAIIGEDTPFYKSTQSWYKVLWTQPKKGNVYYILAFQYIAARLNIAAGASSTPEVNAALVLAEAFFSAKTPTEALALSKQVRNFYVGLADILDSYNNGYIGPGHCSN